MAQLKISTLSVGDWVQDKEGTPAKILGIEQWSGEYYLNVEVNGADVGNVIAKGALPIPITPEILEKNGFKDVSGGLFRYEREWRDDKIAVMLCSFDEELWFVDFDFRGGRCVRTNIPIFYINQLQHILSLAGVDKEIGL